MVPLMVMPRHEGDGTKGDGTKAKTASRARTARIRYLRAIRRLLRRPPLRRTTAPNQSVQQAIHANNKPVGASIFNGTNPAHAPSFVKITAVLDKDGGEVSEP